MSEYMLQVAAKLEISCEESAIWEMSDICNVVTESLNQLYKSENQELGNLTNHHILHIIEMMKQYPPSIQREKVTSYFHRNGMRHWFYIGTVDDKGKAQRYDAVSLYYPGEDFSGILNLDHVIKVPEGEFKVMGIAKFSPLTNTIHKIKKLTMPEDIKQMVAKHSIKETLIKASNNAKMKPRQQKLMRNQIRKPIQKRKQNGVSSFLKYIAPGASTLLLAGQYSKKDHGNTTSGEEEDPADEQPDLQARGYNESEA